MTFKNRGGGSRVPRQFPEQVTTSLTAEQYSYLQSQRQLNLCSLADIMRECIERCKKLDAGSLDKTENVSCAREEYDAVAGGVATVPL